MADYIKLFLIINNFLLIYCKDVSQLIDKDFIQAKHFVFWPNATVPFYIDPNHFDHEQSLTIMTSLSMFAFKTCLKFAPVMAPPLNDQHVLTFVNPDGIRRCVVDTRGHSVYDPHYLIVGYDCLKSPYLEMTIMKALGFPFEHNRHSRDVFIEVMFENIEISSIELFTKDVKLPQELRNLPYDYNSVMHFGDREYSKNGHRTIIFKNHNIVQNRGGLTATDLRKIEIVYGPECLLRDRQEKIDMCQEYPGVARRKRDTIEELNIEDRAFKPEDYQNALRKKREIKEERLKNVAEYGDRRKRDTNNVTEQDNKDITVDIKKNVQLEPVVRSLRVNRNITPPPENETNLTDTLRDLGIEDEVNEIVEKVYKVSALALKNARAKYCNNSKSDLRVGSTVPVKNGSDILGIIESVASYAASMVDHAMANLTAFCENSGSIDEYQRARCSWSNGRERCVETYRSTKSGRVRYSTQHRPTYYQFTKHDGHGKVIQYVKSYRSGNTTDSDEITTEDKVTEPATAENVKIEDVTEGDVITNVVKKVTEDIKAVAQNDTTDAKVRRKRDIEKVAIEDDKNLKNSVEIYDLNNTIVKDLVKTETTISEGMKAIVGEVINTKTTIKDEKAFGDGRKRYIQGRRPRSRSDEDKVSGEWTPTESAEKYAKKKVKKERKDELEAQKESSGKKRHESKAREVKHKQKRTKMLPKSVDLTKANVEFYKERRWPEGVVRYIIKEDSTFDIDDLRDRINAVNSILQMKTCVRLKEISENDAIKYDDYLVLDTSPDYVTGRVGGRQHFGSIELFRGNQHKQHTAMMIMAMLGFYFEVSRHDRDEHVRVHMRHVRPDKLHHFEKIREEATFDLPYDYESATHPAWQFWRKVGKTGISTVATFKEKDPDATVMKSLGQNEQLLSDLDIVKINSIYGFKCFHSKREKKENNKSDY